MYKFVEPTGFALMMPQGKKGLERVHSFGLLCDYALKLQKIREVEIRVILSNTFNVMRGL